MLSWWCGKSFPCQWKPGEKIAVNMSPMYCDIIGKKALCLIWSHFMICLSSKFNHFFFLWHCEANILVALIEGCGGGGGVGGDVVTSCWWIAVNGCLFKLLLINCFIFFKKNKSLIIHWSCNQVIFLLQQMQRGTLKSSHWDFLGRMLRYCQLKKT